MKKILEKA